MSRRNRSNRKPSIIERVAMRKEAKEEEARHLVNAKIQRKDQAEIWENLVRRHGGDVPIPVIHRFMADRRKATIAPKGSSA